MKKFIACVLVLVLCVSVFAGCNKAAEPAATALDKAKSYVFLLYKDGFYKTPADYQVVSIVNIDGTVFNIDWSIEVTKGSAAAAKIGTNDGKVLTIDVDEKCPEDTEYKLTATLKNDKGETKSVSFERMVAAVVDLSGASYTDIVNAAYDLDEGAAMTDTNRLYGTITKIDTPWSADYKNITVTIAIEGAEDKPIQCYRLKGDNAENLKVGDKITVEGILKNYKGTIEFDAGCVLMGMAEMLDEAKILEAAYALEDGAAMNDPVALKGKITKIDTAWSPDYKNITVTIAVEGFEDKPIMCYRLKGEGAEGLAVGDIINVTGKIKNYKGTIEFDAGCELLFVVKGA